MRKFIERNKEWFDRSNALFVDFSKQGGRRAGKNVIGVLNLKRDLYFSVSHLINHLSDQRLNVLSTSSFQDNTMQVKSIHFDSFKQDILIIYNKLKKGQNHRKHGLAESTVELVDKRITSTIRQLFEPNQIESLRQAMIIFWTRFFSHKDRMSGSSDATTFDELVDGFEQEINQIIGG